MPENIFISYARHDGESHANKFNTDLKALGYETWFDKDRDGGIQPGLTWQKEIQQGIDNCTVFILVMTPASINSDNCFAEWSRALGHNKTVIPLRMQPTNNSDPVEYNQLPLYIENLQYIDFVADFDSGWKQLTHRLEKLEDENFQTAQKNARQAYGILSQFAKGYWLTDSEDVPRLAETLIGRDALKTQINTLLQANKTALLYGVGGVGKSALASELAADQLDSDGRPILWIEVGNAPIEQVFSAIGQACGIQQEMARAQTDEEKVKLTRDLIRGRDIAWLVIDDAWNPAALTTLLKAIPRRNPIPVLITSRQRHIINGELHRVDNLLPDDARNLLTHHMANNKQHDGADDLCHTMSYHPFMLEIAGKLLKQRDIAPQRLLDDMEATDITTLSLPEGVAEAGRESMAKLLKQSLDALPDDLTRDVFLAFGAFPNPTATPEMLALYLSTELEEMNEQFYAEFFAQQKPVIENLINLISIQTALNILFDHGLVRRIHSEIRDNYPYSLEYYRVHDLSHAYGANQNPNLEQMVSACLIYTWRHNTSTYDNFAALRSELDNLVGASVQAKKQNRLTDVEQFAWNIASIAGSHFTHYQGYHQEEALLLLQALSSAEQRGNKRIRIRHLINLGLSYEAVGNYQEAIKSFRLANKISIKNNDAKGIANSYSSLGNVYFSLGDYESSIDFHRKSLKYKQDKRSIANSLGGLGYSYWALEDYETAINYLEQGLTIRNEIKDIRGKGNTLNNLAAVYAEQGNLDKAIDYYNQRLEIAIEIGDERGKGSGLGNLGSMYYYKGEFETALNYLQAAIKVQSNVHNYNAVALTLFITGMLLCDLEEYDRALPLLEESVELTKQLGQLHLVEQRENELNRARKGLRGE